MALPRLYGLTWIGKVNLESIKTTNHDWILRYWVIFCKFNVCSFLFFIRRISNIRLSSFLGHFFRIAKFSLGSLFLDCVVCTTMQCAVLEVAAGVTCMVSQERLKAFCFVFYVNKYRHLSYWKSLFICLRGEIYNFVLLCFVMFCFCFYFWRLLPFVSQWWVMGSFKLVFPTTSQKSTNFWGWF